MHKTQEGTHHAFSFPSSPHFVPVRLFLGGRQTAMQVKKSGLELLETHPPLLSSAAVKAYATTSVFPFLNVRAPWCFLHFSDRQSRQLQHWPRRGANRRASIDWAVRARGSRPPGSSPPGSCSCCLARQAPITEEARAVMTAGLAVLCAPFCAPRWRLTTYRKRNSSGD